jgi:uncharacterized protein YndB with AHSA1/START domain
MSDDTSGVVEQTVRIEARPETVWKYWTEPERLCAWWGATAELDPRPGGVYRVVIDGGPTMLGEYLEVEPFTRLVFSFGWEQTGDAPAIPPGTTRVEVTLADEDGDTIMVLRHTGLPVMFADVHVAGWTRRLPMLLAAVRTAARKDAAS